MKPPGGPALRRLIGAPGLGLALAVHLYLALFALALFTVLAMPDRGLRAAPAGESVALVPREGQPLLVPPDTMILFTSAEGKLATPAKEMIPDFMPSGGAHEMAKFFRDRDRLAGILSTPGAYAVLRTGSADHVEPLERRPRSLASLPLDFWLLSAQAIAIGLLGIWLRLARPHELGSWMFGASCDGVLLAGLSGAVFDGRVLSASGSLLWTMYGINLIGTNLCAMGLAAIFLYVPRRVAPPWLGIAMLAAAMVLGVLEAVGLVPLKWFYTLLLFPNLAFIVTLWVQWRVTSGDPKARTVIRLVGASTFAGAALVCLGMVIPALFDIPSFGSDGMTIVPLAVIYGGIAFGVAGVRLFALDSWSYRLILGASTLLLLLLGDALVLRLMNADRPVALMVTLLATGYAYFPLRSWLLRRMAGGPPLSRDALFRQAALVAFGAEAAARRDGWRELLQRVFAPLELGLGEAADDVRLERTGEILRIPATADDEALRLRFARNGTRLFSLEDADLARELVMLAHEAAKARAAYIRGVNEERGRIARDLHDDVSGLLLTGLHRGDVAAVRSDVQQALGEIRTMVSSLSGECRSLDDVLADLRYETANRLAAAGVDLDWPVEEARREDDLVLDYARARAVASSLRELVTNAIKHSNAKRMRILISRHAGRLEILASDDGGAHARVQPSPGSGRGLMNIARRFDEVGGTCRIEPSHTGFRVRLSLSLSPAD